LQRRLSEIAFNKGRSQNTTLECSISTPEVAENQGLVGLSIVCEDWAAWLPGDTSI